MKRICFFISDISACGGTERVCMMIANELCRRGYEVHIVSSLTRQMPFFEYDKRIKFHTLLTSALDRRLKYKRWYKCWKIRRLLDKIKVQFVIDTMQGDTVATALRGRKEHYVLWINFSHDVVMAYPPHRHAVSIVSEDDRQMVTLTKQDRRLFIQDGVKPENVRCIYNPLTFRPMADAQHDSKKVISVGRFAAEKGYDLLLQAWAAVERRCDDWTLEIWGDDGRYENNLPQIVEQLGLRRVSLHGTTNDVRSLMSSASIYVMSSRHEGFGLVLVEASACGLPLVAFDCPNGPREIVENERNGLLVPPEDIAGMAEALLRLINNEDERKRIGQQAFAMSERFAIGGIGDEWEAYMKDILMLQEADK